MAAEEEALQLWEAEQLEGLLAETQLPVHVAEALQLWGEKPESLPAGTLVQEREPAFPPRKPTSRGAWLGAEVPLEEAKPARERAWPQQKA